MFKALGGPTLQKRWGNSLHLGIRDSVTGHSHPKVRDCNPGVTGLGCPQSIADVGYLGRVFWDLCCYGTVGWPCGTIIPTLSVFVMATQRKTGHGAHVFSTHLQPFTSSSLGEERAKAQSACSDLAYGFNPQPWGGGGVVARGQQRASVCTDV